MNDIFFIRGYILKKKNNKKIYWDDEENSYL